MDESPKHQKKKCPICGKSIWTAAWTRCSDKCDVIHRKRMYEKNKKKKL